MIELLMPWNDNRPLEFYKFYYFDNIVKLVFVIRYSSSKSRMQF
jgi:hypothetical protein